MAIRENPAQRRGTRAGSSTVRTVRRRPDRRITAAQPPDFFHQARDADYLRQLRAEAEYWDNHPETLLSKFTIPIEERAAFGMEQRYQNERLTGDADRRWFEVISDYGEFRHGCVLGAGPGEVESHLLRKHEQLHLTVYDISREALARLQDRLEQEFPGRIETREEDLNFVELPVGAYDLFIANACMHHIVNLEHLAFQVNQCLTPDGYFFMKDTVGESYFQFSEEKKRLYQALINATRGDSGPDSQIEWPDLNDWSYSPYESVRSGEILEILPRYLSEIRVRTLGALLELNLFAESRPPPIRTGIFRIPGIRRVARATGALYARLLRRKANARKAMARTELMLMLDKTLIDTGYLMPGNAFAIYQKRL